MQIPILYGPNCLRDSIWCEQIRIGMEQLAAQRRYTLCKIDDAGYQNYDYDTLFDNSPRLLILISTERAWTEQALSFFEQREIHVILIGESATESSAIQGQVLFHYESAIRMLLEHLHNCGCSRTALFGFLQNSASDSLKKRFFQRKLQLQGVAHPESRCFENRKDLVDCYETFRAQIEQFDSVICVNDIAAALLARRLIQDGIRIPEDIQVVTIGSSTKLRQIQSLTLTGIDFSDRELGKNAVLLYRYLWHDFCDTGTVHIFSQILISGDLNIGNSTLSVENLRRQEKSMRSDPSSPTHMPRSFYEDHSVHTYSAFERLIHACDEKDLQILHSLLEDNSYEKIADRLFLSKSSVHYRIRRMEKTIGVQSLEQLKSFLRNGRFEDFLKPQDS